MSKLGSVIWFASIPVVLAMLIATSGRSIQPQPPVSSNVQETGQSHPRLDRPPRLERPAADIVEVTDVVYATIEQGENRPTIELRFDAAFPAQTDGQALPAVVYIHGGGFRSGSKSSGRALTAALARRGFFAATIEYRLSEVAQYPAAIHDCKAAIRFLRAHAQELVIDPNRIGVWGHSAGAHLAAYLAVTGNAPETDGSVGETGISSSVHCAVAISGVYDFLTLSGVRNGRRLRDWLGSKTGDAWERRLREASPLHWVDASDPPILLIHGTDDPLIPIEQSQQMAAALRNADVPSELMEVKGGGHTIRDRNAYLRAMEFFDRQLTDAANPED